MRKMVIAIYILILITPFSAHANCKDNSVVVKKIKSGNNTRLVAQSSNLTDFTITITADLTNMKSSKKLPLTISSDGEKSITLIEFSPINPNQKWKYSYSYHWKPGGNIGKQDKNFKYALPFETNKNYKLIQGPLGNYSHYQGSQDEQAYDWAMPVGTRILAAREGKVVGIKQNSSENGTTDDYKSCANYIILKHSDGTYAEYFHIKKNGALVKLGDRVEQGKPIALSGNTGYSTEPHLHFAVYNTKSGNLRKTVAIKFE